jgi:hypothetical protein
MFLAVPAVRAEENPLVIIERAMEARGGEAKLAQIEAVGMKIKGSVFVGQNEVPFTAEILSQAPGQYKHVMHFTIGGETRTQVQVYDGEKAWIRVGDQLVTLDDDLRVALLKGRYAERLAGLTILKKKGYQLSLAGTSKVRDKEASVVNVAFSGKPDVRLFFDKETGLLVKTEHRQLDPQRAVQGNKQEVLQETFYSEYRVPDTIESDLKTLQAAKVPADGPSLIEFFRAKAKAGADRDKIAALVRQLGDNSFPVREKASQELVELGEAAVSFLKQALKSSDLEVVRRAEGCLQMIRTDPARKERENAVSAAAVRLLAAKKSAGATEALLAFLPLANDEAVEREIRAALRALALLDAKPDPTLVQALADKDPLQQSAAAEALGKVPLPPGRKIIIGGVKRPMKAEVFRDGAVFMTREVLEVTYFNKLDDKLFAMP